MKLIDKITALENRIDILEGKISPKPGEVWAGTGNDHFLITDEEIRPTLIYRGDDQTSDAFVCNYDNGNFSKYAKQKLASTLKEYFKNANS